MNLDRTFCASPDCTNKCGRQMEEKQKQFVKGHPWYPVSYGYFCGQPCKHEWVSGSFLVTHCKKCGTSENG